MAGSKLEVRDGVIRALVALEQVHGSTLTDVRDELGMTHVTVTQFTKAVGSLHYNSGQITWSRDGNGSPGSQSSGHVLILRQHV